MAETRVPTTRVIVLTRPRRFSRRQKQRRRLKQPIEKVAGFALLLREPSFVLRGLSLAAKFSKSAFFKRFKRHVEPQKIL